MADLANTNEYGTTCSVKTKRGKNKLKRSISIEMTRVRESPETQSPAREVHVREGQLALKSTQLQAIFCFLNAIYETTFSFYNHFHNNVVVFLLSSNTSGLQINKVLPRMNPYYDVMQR